MIITPLKFDDFYARYKADIQPFDASLHPDFSSRINSLQGSLVAELEASGLEEDIDFQVGYDFNQAYFVCGIIHDSKNLSREVIDSILRAFAGDSEPGSWVFHLCIESPETRSENQFYVKGDGSIVIQEENGWSDIRDRISSKEA